MSKVKASKNKISQTINLSDALGVKFRGQRALKEAFGQAVIDHILERTDKNKAIGGKRDLRGPYSKEYRESLDFKAFGKSKNDINMKLTGDMLGSMSVTKIDGNNITIGFDDETEEKKAANHHQGITVTKRPFFGVNKTELKDLAKEFRSEIKDIQDASGSQRQRLILGLIDKLTGDESDGDS